MTARQETPNVLLLNCYELIVRGVHGVTNVDRQRELELAAAIRERLNVPLELVAPGRAVHDL